MPSTFAIILQAQESNIVNDFFFDTGVQETVKCRDGSPGNWGPIYDCQQNIINGGGIRIGNVVTGWIAGICSCVQSQLDYIETTYGADVLGVVGVSETDDPTDPNYRPQLENIIDETKRAELNTWLQDPSRNFPPISAGVTNRVALIQFFNHFMDDPILEPFNPDEWGVKYTA